MMGVGGNPRGAGRAAGARAAEQKMSGQRKECENKGVQGKLAYPWFQDIP